MQSSPTYGTSWNTCGRPARHCMERRARNATSGWKTNCSLCFGVVSVASSGGLRQMRTKGRITGAQAAVLTKTITYFENHRHMMAYDEYLAKGYPVATGLVEGVCNSLVNNRMEQSGMRWSFSGAEAMLQSGILCKRSTADLLQVTSFKWHTGHSFEKVRIKEDREWPLEKMNTIPDHSGGQKLTVSWGRDCHGELAVGLRNRGSQTPLEKQ